MDREQRRDLFEAVGLAAIVASLVFLALEIRQNTNALFAESRQSVLNAAQTELLVLTENPDLILAVLDDDPLTEGEQVKLSAWLTAAMRAREFSWLQYRDGIIDEAQWDTEVVVILWILDTPRTRDWWENIGQFSYSAGFVEFVGELINDNPTTGDSWRAEANWTKR